MDKTTYSLNELNTLSSEVVAAICNVACENGYLNSTDWNDGNFDLVTLLESMGIEIVSWQLSKL